MDILIGRTGFLGRAIELTSDRHQLLPLSRSDFDLLNGPVPSPGKLTSPKNVIYAADYYPGISETSKLGPKVYSANVAMYENLFAFAAATKAKRVITIGTSGCYPQVDTPLTEEMFNQDPSLLNPKLLSYALSRFTLFDIAALYKITHNISHLHLILPNFYGPGDNYTPGRSHLLASWVRDFAQAKADGQSQITLFGPPDQTREFIFIDDAARLVTSLAAAEVPHEVLNVATSTRPTYEELANSVLHALDFSPTISWQPRPTPRLTEVLDISRLLSLDLDDSPPTSLARGLSLTVADFAKTTPRPLTDMLHHASPPRTFSL